MSGHMLRKIEIANNENYTRGIRMNTRLHAERARRDGKRLGSPPATGGTLTSCALRARDLSHPTIAPRLGIGESSVRRILSIYP